MKKFTIAVMAMLLAFAFAPASQAKVKFVTIGTGGVTGVYYPTGGAISRMVNKKSKEYGIKATVESTGGSVYNVNAVISGDLEFGVAQSDVQYKAYNGQGEWEGKPQTNLRSVFSVHPESITLIASESSGIKDFLSMKDKRVNLGNPGSGQLQNTKDLLEAFGVGEDYVKAEYIKAVEAPGLLQDERIDAFFYTVGHPNGNIKEATSGRIKVMIVPITGAPVDKLIAARPYYAKSKIAVSDYPTAINKEDIDTVGVKATIVTSADVDDDSVYAVTKEVFENFEEFKKLHPAYALLEKEDLLKGLSAPIHPGALKYYKEAGLDKFIDKSLILN
jgi:TRAP transporter TAXI family solute receptor